MKKRIRNQRGFTLIEVIASTALLLVAVMGFLMMTGANAGLLAGEHRLDKSNYELNAMAGEGEGEATGRSMAVEFTMEDSPPEDGPPEEDSRRQDSSPEEDSGRAEEIFDEYSVGETWEDGGNSMTFYRHR